MFIVEYKFYYLAQSAGEAAQKTAEDTRQIVSKITTDKLFQGLLILLAAYITLKVLDRLVNWLSERTAKEWRLRVKQFLPFLRMVVLTFTIAVLMNMFLNL